MKKLFNEIEYFFINVDLFVFAMVAAMVVVLVVCIVIGVNTCSVEKVTVVDVETEQTHTTLALHMGQHLPTEGGGSHSYQPEMP